MIILKEKHEAKFLHDNDIVDQEDGVRRISQTILKNRGLQRKRPKEGRNSRVKLKNKYADALTKLKVCIIYISVSHYFYRVRVFIIVIRVTDTNGNNLVLEQVTSRVQNLILSSYSILLY